MVQYKLHINTLNKWANKSDYPLIISGPCSAENELQVLETAKQLARIPEVKIFRAGIWKPRTRPGSFEGVGDIGLSWLQKVKKETGLKIAVEVANPRHVEAALKHQIDILWIGARTVVNPFSMQDLASSIEGVDIPIMIKNPVNPDLGLWIGAIERFYRAGINELAAIHRGFYLFDKSPYRNAPMWEIPIELKRQIPNIPIICDPSHICGEKSLLPEISQKALDLEMDGLMIEVHPNPQQALTDQNQQITPLELINLLEQFVIRTRIGNVEFQSKLDELRSEIDKIDAELLQILTSRMHLIDEIGHYKNENNITILQLKHWTKVVKDRLSRGVRLGLDKEFLQKLLEIVHAESIRRQTDIYHKSSD